MKTKRKTETVTITMENCLGMPLKTWTVKRKPARAVRRKGRKGDL